MKRAAKSLRHQPAKTLPKVEHKPRQLTYQEELERDEVRACIQAYRSRAKVGDLHMADESCSRCGEQRIREIVDIRPGGGITWEARCLTCSLSD